MTNHARHGSGRAQSYGNLTIMIDNGKVPQFAQQGCWLTCHDGQRDMAKQFTSEEVKVNALLTAIKKGDVRKYLPATRIDPSGWKEGDMIPDYVISREDAKGSAADNNAIASWKHGTWTVVVLRPLGLANDDDRSLKEGGVYNVGFGMHDDNITTRSHHVSFVRTLGFGAKADIQAVKIP